MKPGLVLGTMALASAIAFSPAQNLGLGTGSRPPAEDSVAAEEAKAFPADDAPRKAQMNRRLGLTARKAKEFDPKVFEARGRELQGQFYEIGTPAAQTQSSGSRTFAAEQPMVKNKDGSRQWMIWVGLAGIAGASAGAVGYIMMQNSHPASAPPDIPLDLSDSP